jgi:hypothetical protein
VVTRNVAALVDPPRRSPVDEVVPMDIGEVGRFLKAIEGDRHTGCETEGEAILGLPARLPSSWLGHRLFARRFR